MGKKAFSSNKGGGGGSTFKEPAIASYRKQLGKNEVRKEKVSRQLRNKKRFQSTGDLISSGTKNWKVVAFILLVLAALFIIYFTFALEISMFFSG